MRVPVQRGSRALTLMREQSRERGRNATTVLAADLLALTTRTIRSLGDN